MCLVYFAILVTRAPPVSNFAPRVCSISLPSLPSLSQFFSSLITLIEHDKPMFPEVSLDPCSFLPVLRGYFPRPAKAGGQKRDHSNDLGLFFINYMGHLTVLRRPEHPPHQESRHTSYHFTQGSPFTARRSCSLTLPHTTPILLTHPTWGQSKGVWFC